MNDLRITNNALGFAAVAGLASVCLQGAAYGEGSEFPDGSVSITSLPFTDTGDTSDNSDEFDAVCPYSGSTSADVLIRTGCISWIWRCSSSTSTSVL